MFSKEHCSPSAIYIPTSCDKMCLKFKLIPQHNNKNLISNSSQHLSLRFLTDVIWCSLFRIDIIQKCQCVTVRGWDADFATHFIWKSKNSRKNQIHDDYFLSWISYCTGRISKDTEYEREKSGYKMKTQRKDENNQDLNERKIIRTEKYKTEKKPIFQLKKKSRRSCWHCNDRHWNNEYPKTKTNLIIYHSEIE